MSFCRKINDTADRSSKLELSNFASQSNCTEHRAAVGIDRHGGAGEVVLLRKDEKWRGVSAVIAPAAAMKTLQFVLQASAGPWTRNSKCIGSVRSEARNDAGNTKTGAAIASAVANKRERTHSSPVSPPSPSSCVVNHVLAELWRRLITPGVSKS